MNKRIVASFIMIAVLYAFAWAQKEPSRRLSIQPESKLWLEGGSTLHDYRCESSQILGTIEADSVQLELQLLNGAAFFHKVEIIIPVKSIHSGSDKMDENMYEALKAGKYPEIKFTLLESNIVSDSSGHHEGYVMKTKGKLMIAGKENLIDMSVQFLKNKSIRVKGWKELFMTHFDVEPPTLMFGVLKTDNRVVIHFDLLLSPQNEQSIKNQEL